MSLPHVTNFVFMEGDYAHWNAHGLYEGFETYVRQRYTRVHMDQNLRKAVLKKVFENHSKQYKN